MKKIREETQKKIEKIRLNAEIIKQRHEIDYQRKLLNLENEYRNYITDLIRRNDILVNSFQQIVNSHNIYF